MAASKARSPRAKTYAEAMKRIERRAQTMGYKSKRDVATYVDGYVAGFSTAANGNPFGGK